MPPRHPSKEQEKKYRIKDMKRQELRKEFDKFYGWLDSLTTEQYDDMSLTDMCEKFFFNSDAQGESPNKTLIKALT